MPDATLNTTPAGWPYLDEDNFIDLIPAYSEQLAEQLDLNEFAQATQGKNLFDKATAIPNTYWGQGQNPSPLAGHQASPPIPVEPGQPYTVQAARNLQFRTADGVMVPGSWVNNTSLANVTVTAPANAVTIGISTTDANVDLMQLEEGSVASPYEPYGRYLDPSIILPEPEPAPPVPGPLVITRTGTSISAVSDLDGQDLDIGMDLTFGGNGVFNFRPVRLGGVQIASASDDVAPVSTQVGNVGANHGLLTHSRWPSGSHDKTTADLGSVWTDGVDEFVLLGITAGDLYAQREYTTGADGEAISNSTVPAGDLTHVSGATNTSPLAVASRTTGQLYPWIQRRRITALLDGTPLAEGATTGQELVIRENYEVLDYGVIYDWCKANPGQSYTTVHHRAAFGVQTEWSVKPGGSLRSTTRLWEISPTRIGLAGFYQAEVMSGTVTRYLPGVDTIAGLNWNNGVPLANLTADQTVTTGHLLNASMPPTVAVDTRADVAMALGISPWVGAGRNTERLASTPNYLWLLRASTKKIYPYLVAAADPGWGQLEAAAIRAYLTPTEAQSIVTDADPLSAWVTLDQLT